MECIRSCNTEYDTSTIYLLHSVLPCQNHGKICHHQVLVKKISRPTLVGTDPTDQSRQMHYDIGRVVMKHPANLIFSGKVILGTAHNENPRTPGLLELFDDVTAQESTPARHQYALFFPKAVHPISPLTNWHHKSPARL